jgi:inner membrane protein
VGDPVTERLAGLGGIAALDAVRISRRQWPVPLLAGLDWPAHLTTAALALTALPRRLDPEIAAWALAGSVAIDLDHIPLYLGLRSVVTEHGGRPVTHSLTTAAALLGAAVPTRGRARKVLAGLGAGVLLHLVRDIGTGGVPLLWPFHHGTVRVPYAAHFAAIAAAAAAPTVRRRSRRQKSYSQ